MSYVTVMKSKAVALILLALFGGFGLHRLYLGHRTHAAIVCVFTVMSIIFGVSGNPMGGLILFGLCAYFVIDFIIIATRRPRYFKRIIEE